MKRQLQTKPECANSSRDASPHTSTESSNDEWIRGEVADAARILQERNLAHANAIATPVSPANGIYVRYVKRILDIVLSGAALLITLPINVVLGALTFHDVGSPLFFHQQRSGKNLEPFDLVKFRNMTNERDENGELLPPEERTTTSVASCVSTPSMSCSISGAYSRATCPSSDPGPFLLSLRHA